MNIREALDLISETREVLISDYKYIHKKDPTNKDLLLHIKTILKEDRVEEILDEVLLDGDFEDRDEVYKMLLIVAAIASEIP